MKRDWHGPPACGATIPGEAMFCPRCGRRPHEHPITIAYHRADTGKFLPHGYERGHQIIESALSRLVRRLSRSRFRVGSRAFIPWASRRRR